MPNWCNNSITLRGTDQQQVQRLADAFKRGEFCDAVIPVPEDLKIVAGRVGDDTNPDQIELERKTAENIKKYGAGNWYDFCTGRWGTKWDVGDEHGIEMDEDGLGFRASFDSAWAPPVGIYEQLLEDGYEVVATYYEPGMGFVGRWDNGYDDHFELSGLNSNTVRDEIGDDLDDEYGISESMAEYEAEEEEELTAWVKDGVEQNNKLKLEGA